MKLARIFNPVSYDQRVRDLRYYVTHGRKLFAPLSPRQKKYKKLRNTKPVSIKVLDRNRHRYSEWLSSQTQEQVDAMSLEESVKKMLSFGPMSRL